MITDSRIVILGGGPAGLGAATRLQQLGYDQWDLLEQSATVGGLASSARDDQGFLWDMGVHVIYSHYAYFDDLMNHFVDEWATHQRACAVWTPKAWVPYPFQRNLHHLPDSQRDFCLRTILNRPLKETLPQNFEEWILKHFGEGIASLFMRPYNQKIWTKPPEDMDWRWLGDRVPTIDLVQLISNTLSRKNDEGWGPNAEFRFPKRGGTGSIWKAVADELEPANLGLRQRAVAVDLDRKVVRTEDRAYPYDILINTIPLDRFVALCRTANATALGEAQEQVRRLNHTSTHVVGLGLKGQPPSHVAPYYWMYFADPSVPFYRATQFSKYGSDHVPRPGEQWSLMFEIAESPQCPGPTDPVEATLEAARRIGLIETPLVSSWHQRLNYGYPVPCLARDDVLARVQPWLESQQVFSRGRFGGWKYEVGNQDHSVMQGVEAADRALFQIEETTYMQPSWANTRRQTTRRYEVRAPAQAPLQVRTANRAIEVVVARFQEDVSWTDDFASCRTIYNKGSALPRETPSTLLPNVGREAHTYLHHIVQHWDDLAELTVFTQGRISDHGLADLNPLLQAHCGFLGAGLGVIVSRQRPHDFTSAGHIRFTGEWLEQSLKGNIRRSEWSYDQWFDQFVALDVGLSSRHLQRLQLVSWGAIFSVHRDCIHSRPKAFYQRLLAQVENHPHPEESHYLERSWVYLFKTNQAPYGVRVAGMAAGKMTLTAQRLYLDKRALGQLGVELPQGIPSMTIEEAMEHEGRWHQSPALLDHGQRVSLALLMTPDSESAPVLATV